LRAEKLIHIKEFPVGTIAHEQVALLTDYDTKSEYTLAYQNLFTNIRFDWDQDKIKQHTITFVTPVFRRSRDEVATNVAIVAAQNGVPTVLIDADLHTHNLQKRFGIQEQQGLSELLRKDETTLQSFSHSLSKTFIPNLSLLSAGSAPHQPVEISRLLAARLPNVIDGLRQYLETNESRPSLIIVHSPPMSYSIDAALISSIVDQTFLLIIMRQTKRTQVQKAQQQLERAHAKSVGVILLDA
jgi:capsular exopolysaccharide synthesis family protein